MFKNSPVPKGKIHPNNKVCLCVCPLIPTSISAATFFSSFSFNILFVLDVTFLFRKYQAVCIPQLQSYCCLEADMETDTEL